MGKPNQGFDREGFRKFNIGPLAFAVRGNRALTDADGLYEWKAQIMLVEHKLLVDRTEPPADIYRRGKLERSGLVPLGQHLLFKNASERAKLVPFILAGTSIEPQDTTHAGFYIAGRWTQWRKAIWPAVFMAIVRWDAWAEEHADWFTVTVGDAVKVAAEARLLDLAVRLERLDSIRPVDLSDLLGQLREHATAIRKLVDKMTKLQKEHDEQLGQESLHAALLGDHDIDGRLALTEDDIPELIRRNEEAKTKWKQPFLSEQDIERAWAWVRLPRLS